MFPDLQETARHVDFAPLGLSGPHGDERLTVSRIAAPTVGQGSVPGPAALGTRHAPTRTRATELSRPPGRSGRVGWRTVSLAVAHTRALTRPSATPAS